MKRKILKITLSIIVCFIGFVLYMSPSFGGLFPGGKEIPDKTVEKLEFDSIRNPEYQIEYKTHNDEPDLIKLRNDFQLDTIVKYATSDFEKVLLIQSWVNSRWKHDGDNIPKKSDAYYILKQAEKGERFRCVEYSLVASACLKSLGFKVRNIGLMTKDVDVVKYGAGHAVSEVYISDLKKWIFIDPQYDIIVTKNGLPLNTVEFQKAIAFNEPITIVNPNKVIEKEDYLTWVGPYLFYFYTSLNKGQISIWDRIIGTKKQLCLVPKGKNNPKYFQRLFRLNNMYFTHSIKDFHQTK